MEKNHRLFLRNLPIDIGKNDLEKLFGEYGKVTNIDIKEKTQNDGSKIAFVNITTTGLKLNTCLRAANDKTFGGCAIDVQVAKESYLDRLKREREEAAAEATKAADASCFKLAASVDHGGQSERQPMQRIKIAVPPSMKNKPTKKKYNFEDTDDTRVPEYSEDQSPIGLPDFSYDPALRAESIPVKSVLASSDSSFCIKVLDHLNDIPEKKVVVESEIKRLASLKKKRQTFKLHEKLISQALKVVDGTRRNNKVVFSQDIDITAGYGDEANGAGAGGRSVSLFVDEEFLEDQEDWNAAEKFQHDERRNAKLKMSLNNPNGDKRFVIDERFLDYEKAKENKKEVTESDEVADNETKWQLDILQNILGHPFRARDEEIGGKKENKMIRYDPTSRFHKNHEMVIERPGVRAKKVKLTNVVVAQEKTPISVSSQVFYEVSENLTESLNTKEEFSLLKSFGTGAGPAPTNDKNSIVEYGATTNGASQKEKWNKFGMEDSLKYDSSSDPEDAPPYPNPSVDQLTCRTKDVSDNFFFVIDDPRFSEAENFFNATTSTGDDDFTHVRRQLKQIVRSKIRNNVKKNTPWRNTKVAKQPPTIR